jgi:hypothetical protein
LHISDGASPEGVSRHVQELLDNLNDSRHSLHDLEDGVTSGRPLPHHGDRSSERPRAGVYSSPMPSFTSARSLQKVIDKMFFYTVPEFIYYFRYILSGFELGNIISDEREYEFLWHWPAFLCLMSKAQYSLLYII